MKSGLIKQILLAGLVAGLLDITAAIVILAKGNAAGTFKFIASGAFGNAAFEGGAGMVAWGVFFHFFIAMSWASLYFLIYPKLSYLSKNKWLNGVLYGLLVWVVMNRLVLPLTQAPQAEFVWASALRGMAILMVCIGLPIAWLADRYYASNLRRQ